MTVVFVAAVWSVLAADARISGRLTDPHGRTVAAALRLTSASQEKTAETTSTVDGVFLFPSLPPGDYQITAVIPGFAEAKKMVHVRVNETVTINLQFPLLASRTDTVNVTANLRDVDVQSPDPATEVFAGEDLLSAN